MAAGVEVRRSTALGLEAVGAAAQYNKGAAAEAEAQLARSKPDSAHKSLDARCGNKLSLERA